MKPLRLPPSPACRYQPMKANEAKPVRGALCRAMSWLWPCLAALGLYVGGGRADAQATPSAPDRLTYQGFLVDANGNALATNAPKNYDIVFRIYDDANGGVLLWSEQQTVTVDRGNFSVILGEGVEVAPEPRPTLSNIFKGATASDRYIALTVKGIGAAGGNADILPRLRLLTSPYAFLAQQATKLVKADGTDLLSANNSSMFLDGNVSVRTNGFIEFGSGLTKEVNAGRIAYSLLTPNTLDIVGAGTTGTNRQVKVFAESGASFTGPVIAPSLVLGANPLGQTNNGAIGYSLRSSGVLDVLGSGGTEATRRVNVIADGGAKFSGAVEALRFVGDGVIPVGGIILWSGTVATIPSGWALCDGANGTPDLRSRFVVGASGAAAPAGLTRYSPGAVGGKETHTLTLSEMPSHTHTPVGQYFGTPDNFQQGSWGQTQAGYLNRYRGDSGPSSIATTAAGGGQAHETRPPYYALAFVMRIR